MSNRRVALLVVLVVSALALVAAACGDNGEETPPAETPALATPTVGAAPTQEAEPTPTVAAPPAEATPTAEAPPEPTPTTEAPPEPTQAAAPTEAAAPAAETVDIAMIPSIQFDKSTITAHSGATVTVRIDNRDDGIPHSFSVYTDSTGSQPLAEGSTGTVCTGPCTDEITFVAPEPGEYFFRCDVHPTQMTGTFIVE